MKTRHINLGIDMESTNWNNCNEKLPEIGERVYAIIILEMVFEGSSMNSGSNWKQDDTGFRAILGWSSMDDKFLNTLKTKYEG